MKHEVARGHLVTRRTRFAAAAVVVGALLVVGCSSSKSPNVNTGGTTGATTGATTAVTTTPTTSSSGGYGY